MLPFRILFWNLARKDRSSLLSLAVVEHEIDLVLIAEPGVTQSALQQRLNLQTGLGYSETVNPSTYFSILTKFRSESVIPLRDHGRISIRHIQPPIGLDFILVVVHLPSKLHASEADQLMLTTRLRMLIEAAEENVGHARTLLVGDLNMNPFELGIIGSEGLHATMSRQVAAREQRTVQGESRRFFYNPMWNHFGDLSGPAGTYYYDTGQPVNFYWNMFDQVLLRPSILSWFDDSDLKVLTSVEGTSLLSVTGRPNQTVGSDHLPLVVTLQIPLTKED